MNIEESLHGVTRLFLDTAPVIYFVERNPQYLALVRVVFQHLQDVSLMGVTSPVTLAECLVHPYRLGQTELQQEFTELIVGSNNITFVRINPEIGQKAAQLRARYNIELPDAFQIAVALAAGCEAFLTNDARLYRVTELRVLVLDELDVI